MNTKKRIVLISAELANLDKTANLARTNSLKNALETKGYNFKMVLGSYKGSLERSFLVDASEDVVNPLKALAGYFKQESILVVNEDQKAFLHYMTGKIDQIGVITQINFIQDTDSWTLVNGLFYTVK